MENKKQIILFDGVCNLCDSFVQFVIKRDKKNKFLFSSLQSDQGEKLLKEYNYNPDNFFSVILIHQNKSYSESTAALKVLVQLGAIWKAAYLLFIIPKYFRDIVYKWIAKNRYQWFGKRDTCMMPTQDLKHKFLE